MGPQKPYFTLEGVEQPEEKRLDFVETKKLTFSFKVKRAILEQTRSRSKSPERGNALLPWTFFFLCSQDGQSCDWSQFTGASKNIITVKDDPEHQNGRVRVVGSTIDATVKVKFELTTTRQNFDQ